MFYFKIHFGVLLQNSFWYWTSKFHFDTSKFHFDFKISFWCRTSNFHFDIRLQNFILIPTRLKFWNLICFVSCLWKFCFKTFLKNFILVFYFKNSFWYWTSKFHFDAGLQNFISMMDFKFSFWYQTSKFHFDTNQTFKIKFWNLICFVSCLWKFCFKTFLRNFILVFYIKNSFWYWTSNFHFDTGLQNFILMPDFKISFWYQTSKFYFET